MAEKKGVGHAYNIDFLNVVFAASSVFLFVAVVWMVRDDYNREWKNTQRQFAELEYQVTQASLEQASRNVDQTKLQQLDAELATAQQTIAANQAKIDELTGQRTEIEARLARESQDFQFAKATYDQDRYDFEASRAAGAADAEAKGERVAALGAQVAELQLQMERTTAERGGNPETARRVHCRSSEGDRATDPDASGGEPPAGSPGGAGAKPREGLFP